MIAPEDLPNRHELIDVLSAEGAPPKITLDIGGSEDIDGDGIVTASLNEQGELILEDA